MLPRTGQVYGKAQENSDWGCRLSAPVRPTDKDNDKRQRAAIMIERKVREIAAIGDLRWRDQLHQRRYRGRGGCVCGVVVEAFEFALDAVRRKLLEVRPCFAPGPTAAGSGGERKFTRYLTLYWLGYGVMGSMGHALTP